MDIKIGVGLDNLVFGMSQEEVKNILGEPDKIIDVDYAIVCFHNDLLIKTIYDKEDELRMYSIEVYNHEAVMFNEKIINREKNKVIAMLKNSGLKNLEFEDYENFDTIFCEEIWSTFQFEFDRLKCIEFSPLFKDDDTRIWPRRV